MPPSTAISPGDATKLSAQLSVPPAATVWFAGQLATLGEPGSEAAFGNVQNAAVAATVPTFVQVTVQITVAPAPAGLAVHTTELLKSAVLSAGEALTGTTVLELLLDCCATASLLAVVVAGTVTFPGTVGVKLTVQPSAPPGATLPGAEHVATGVPGSAAVLTEHVATVAVDVPTFLHNAVQTTGAPTIPGVGEQLTVLTMSGVFPVTGGATILTTAEP